MKKIFSVLALTTILTLSSFGSFAANASKTDNGIPDYVLQLVNQKVEDNKYVIPEAVGYESDVNGNLTKVTPLSQREFSEDSISTMSVPNDGYIYIFNDYIATSASTNWYYRSVGTFRFSNQTSTPVSNVKYEQYSSTTVKWSVSGSISGTATIGTKFLAAVEVKAGVSVGAEKTWNSGTSYGATYTVPAKTIYYLTNYQVGVNAGGQLLYNKYYPNGSSAGVYTESAGGTAISSNDVNIELTASEPIR